MSTAHWRPSTLEAKLGSPLASEGRVARARLAAEIRQQSQKASQHFYPVGAPGEPWGDAERAQWLSTTSVRNHSAADTTFLNRRPSALAR